MKLNKTRTVCIVLAFFPHLVIAASLDWELSYTTIAATCIASLVSYLAGVYMATEDFRREGRDTTAGVNVK